MKPDPTIMSEYSGAFHGFKESAFRLETLDQYLVDSEADAFERFKQGQPLRPPRSGTAADWDTLISGHRSAGRTMQRIHLIPKKLTPYLRFEFEWCYCFT